MSACARTSAPQSGHVAGSDPSPSASRTIRVEVALIQFRGRVDYAAGVSLRRSNSAGLIWPSVVWSSSKPRSLSSSSTSPNESEYRRYQRTAHRISSGSVCRHLKIAGRIAFVTISSGCQPPPVNVATQPLERVTTIGGPSGNCWLRIPAHFSLSAHFSGTYLLRSFDHLRRSLSCQSSQEARISRFQERRWLSV